MMPMLSTPYGLPARFHTLRSWQDDSIAAINSAFSDGVKFVAAQLPTGSGKSVIGASIANLCRESRAAYLVSTKGLQDQFLGDFPEYADIRGKSNYDCLERSSLSCEQRRFVCKMGEGCSHSVAFSCASQAKLVLSNYSKWIATAKNARSGGLQAGGPIDTLICDEAHTLEDELTRAMTIQIERGRHGVSKDMDSWPLERIQAWARQALASMPIEVDSKEERERLDREKQDLQLISKLDDNWVWEWKTAGRWAALEFAPIWAGRYGPILWQNAERILLTSATLVPGILSRCGIAESACAWVRVPPVFDLQRNPVYWVRTARISRNTSEHDWDVWGSRQVQICNQYWRDNTIIHSKSFARAEAIISYLKNGGHGDRIISNLKQTAQEAVEEYKERGCKEPVILVGPSFTTGYDFPDNECRVQILSKIPYPDTRSKLMTARVAKDKSYSNLLTVLETVQTFGRAMRHERDGCTNFVIDDMAGHFNLRNGQVLKQMGVDIRLVSAVPPPRQF